MRKAVSKLMFFPGPWIFGIIRRHTYQPSINDSNENVLKSEYYTLFKVYLHQMLKVLVTILYTFIASTFIRVRLLRRLNVRKEDGLANSDVFRQGENEN